ncbi:orf116 [Trichoplusia ni single nucleopolyhedrovirus]|uniref:Orf116 n=1 Tax=Trichoplusia ni single nucleopolyhedrovirus TaxID=332054 RepID=Q461V0_9ABAC|nr:orf116 [Trichoplusia ni single nucleopolyhedrovirus]AAZ67486.1 orf116 [Trichoplusia ni single nucleopolyhedrovirus]
MNEYSTSFRAYRELLSIKRALWLYVSLMFCGFAIFIGMSVYAGGVIYAQIEDISQTVGAAARSQKELQNHIKKSFDNDLEADIQFSLIIRSSSSVQLKINTYPEQNFITFTEERVTCPGSAQYENYIKTLYDRDTKPDIHNVYLFYGGHGLGKSFAAQQLGKAMSKFGNVVVVSVPMTNFIGVVGFNTIGNVIQSIEAVCDNCFVIWMFDELDSYLINNRDSLYQSKSITEFAEYTGFVKNHNRILAFTMNNGEILRHDYWAHQDEISNHTYEYERDFRKALAKTGMSSTDFLVDGQLSRLRSFVGNKIFKFKRFNRETAKRFINMYLPKHMQLSWNNQIENKLFGNETALAQTYDVRTLVIALDDVLNVKKINKT